MSGAPMSSMGSKVAWPSGLRRWFKAPVSSEAWVRIPPLPKILFSPSCFLLVDCFGTLGSQKNVLNIS